MRLKVKHYDNKDIYKVMTDIEVPCIDAIVDMELNGIEIDSDYAERMSKEYHRRADDIQRKIDEELFRLSPIINEWKLTPEANAQQRVYPAKKTKMTEEKIAQAFPLIDEKGLRYKIGSKSKVEQLSDPIELNSVTQLQILLYDILKIAPLNKNEPRATDADTMDELAKKVPICKLIVEKRGVDILINTFIDKMPEIKNVGTGRVHAKFNQYGAATGRLSSSDPNLQNIPSHDKAIRMMFKASKGYSLVGADFGAQEPRSLASFSHDEAMLKAYDEDKDLYAVIGTAAFHTPYEENLEFSQRLVECNSHEDVVKFIDNKFVFLITDIVCGIKAADIKIGDKLYTNEGCVEVYDVKINQPYVDVFVKK